ncbi:cupin domain-containing protein [Leeia sp. TBRC 13508]|uniref:Cupin domain-containing protein n=1 Tax=Leeia speluncae TaxID=2884804 RepID=A0ABS8DAJ4_9NEIS|nr:cupin domain-containing protein [Leeia speluncae]MCB6185227.1 cupin domain-containing protein [Leeia speluncae]
MKSITHLGKTLPEGSIDYPKPERLIKGNPKRSTHPFFASTHGDMDVGIWQCEVGAWKIAFADDTDEFFSLIEGCVHLHDESGHVTEILPGEAAVIPSGFHGIFEVISPVKKHYVFVKRNKEV